MNGIDQRSIDTAAGARRTFAPGKISMHPAVLSRTQLVLYVTLLLMLFASAFVPRAAAQDIFVGGLDSSDFTVTIGKYASDGSPIDPHFITELRSYVQSMSISGAALVVPNDDSTSEVLDYDITVGKTLNFNVPVPYPASAVVAGPYVFMLYDYPAKLGEYVYSTGAPNPNLPPLSVNGGTVMAASTDASGITHLYITIFDSGTGLPNSGSILHVKIKSDGTLAATPDTIASGLNYPTGIAVSEDGNYVYVVDFKTVIQDDVGYLSRYKSSGGPALYRVQLPVQSPYGVATRGGAVFVTGYGSFNVSEYYAATGATINDNLIQGVSLPTAIAIGPPSCVAPPSNLIAWYSLDQKGSSQSDLAGQNTATAYNTTNISGEVAGALQFNGKNSYVEAQSTAQNNVGTSDFSIDAWVKVASLVDQDAVRTIVDKRDGLPTGYHFFLFNGRVGVQVADAHDYGNFISNTTVPADNQWHMVAVTVVRNSNTGGTLYLDGAPIGTFDPTKYSGSLNNTFPLRIGTRSLTFGASDGWFKGGIDEVEVFKRALSAGEILSIMQAGPAGKCKCTAPPSKMVAWYGFDQAGNTQKDLSTTNNTATAYNTVSVIGEVAGALQFNGTNSYVEALSASALNLGRNDFSIDAWVRIASPDDDAGVVVVMDKRDGAQGYHFYLYNGRVGVQLADSNGYDNYVSPASAAVPADNQWHLIGVTVVRNSPTGGTWYVDGLPVGNFDPTAHQSSLDSTTPLDIGVRSEAMGGSGYFKGGIDELEIFNRALSLTEMKTLKQAGHAGKCKN
jgi:hypothetical protein